MSETESYHPTAEEILQNYSPENIYNAHETGLYFRALPSSSYIKKDSGEEEFQTTKDRVTLLLTCNLKGEKDELLLVGNSENPTCLINISNPPIRYYASSTACMTSRIFEHWILSWDRRLRGENRKIVLFVKDCHVHKCKVQLRNISIQYITSSTSTFSLPCQMGLCTALKAYYRYEMRHRIIEILEDTEKMTTIDDAVEHIDLLEVLLMMKTAWDKIPVKTIQSCWKIAGFGGSDLDSIDNELAQIQLPNPPVGLTAEEFASWVLIDDDVDTIEERSKILNRDRDHVERDISDLQNDDSADESLPCPTEMRRCLNRVRIGLQQTDFEDMNAFYSIKQKIDDHLREKFPYKQKASMRFFNSAFDGDG